MPCKSVDENKLKCPIHDDYFKVRNGIIKFFTNKTIYSLVKSATKQEKISI